MSADLLIGPMVFHDKTIDACSRRAKKIESALAANSPDDTFALTFEDALSSSCFSPDGESTHVRQSFLGRCRKPLFRRIRSTAPIMARARQGDYQCSILQPDHELRAKVKQLRRLNSLLGLQASLQRPQTRTHISTCRNL